LGEAPTLETEDSLVDAWLYVKVPWESDGDGYNCNGGPKAGELWTKYIQVLSGGFVE
jgi:endoglucanase